ncbi:hypothetical protein [Helicobacter sp. MIT 99-5507]|uniref:hypothetical protein n=1 Tax=Helicobacter sp. MIT 99-5507 TaxID=152489 RepID=UPI000E1EB209|nr:hypothetical protein [Helicobacter sp. MIT 99-5507]RDU57812.1 hypothetical protein CQA42_02605 [Helicobacter sp. MIT 99-5507]
MRFILLASIFINIIFANDLIITKKFTASKEIEPKFLFVNIEVDSSSTLRNIGELKNSDREKITNTLNSVINEAQSSKICKGGSFSITPIISYEKDTRKTIGQNVDFNLNCKFLKDDLNTYNNLLSNINNIISQNKLLSLPQPSINYRITEDEIEQTKDDLFDEFIEKIVKIENKYSNILNRQCRSSNISYDEDLRAGPITFKAMAMADSSITANRSSAPVSAPILDTTRITIDVMVQLNCK